jgi:hypothetical protein
MEYQVFSGDKPVATEAGTQNTRVVAYNSRV